MAMSLEDQLQGFLRHGSGQQRNDLFEAMARPDAPLEDKLDDVQGFMGCKKGTVKGQRGIIGHYEVFPAEGVHGKKGQPFCAGEGKKIDTAEDLLFRLAGKPTYG